MSFLTLTPENYPTECCYLLLLEVMECQKKENIEVADLTFQTAPLVTILPFPSHSLAASRFPATTGPKDVE